MKNNLTSRERVLRAFHHEEPDRVPIHYLYNPGIHLRLKQHFGLAEDDEEGLLCRLGVDFRGIYPAYSGPRLHAEIPGLIVDPAWGTRNQWVAHESGGYWDYCDFPLKDASEEVFEEWPFPSPDDLIIRLPGSSAKNIRTGRFTSGIPDFPTS